MLVVLRYSKRLPPPATLDIDEDVARQEAAWILGEHLATHNVNTHPPFIPVHTEVRSFARNFGRDVIGMMS
jgi:hypothetical protein